MSCVHLTKTSTNHPLIVCKNHIDIALYNRLVEETDWLDDKALNEIKGLFFRSLKRTFFTENVLHRLEQIKPKTDIPFLRLSIKQLKDISFDISSVFTNQILLNDSIKVKNDPKELLADFYSYANEHNIFHCQLPVLDIPSANVTIAQVNKLRCDVWWLANIKQTCYQQRELLRIALGKVHNRNQRYASNEAVQSYKHKADAEKKYLSNLFFKCKKTGGNICVADLKPSDQRKFAEFYAVSKGIEKRAKSKGLMSSLLTLTLPAKYHANPKYGNSLKWQGLTPQEGYKELSAISNRLNKVFHKAGFYLKNEFYSIKAFEPHTDSTPHLHILLFYRTEFKEKMKQAICYQFNDAIFDDNTKAYTLIDIDTKKNAPITYLCKHFLHSKKNSIPDNIRVAAAKALWEMKSFSYTVIPRGAKTLWKLFRKLKDEEQINSLDADLTRYACDGDFENFMITLEHAIETKSIKLVYKKITSKYNDISSAISHIEFYEEEPKADASDKKNTTSATELDHSDGEKKELVKVVTNLSKSLPKLFRKSSSNFFANIIGLFIKKITKIIKKYLTKLKIN